MHPVSDYQYLSKTCEELLKDDVIKAVMLINCGAIIDLYDFFSVDKTGIKNIFVIDYHRPYHRVNIDNKKQIFLFDSEGENKEDDEAIFSEESEESDDYNSSQEEEEGEGEEEKNEEETSRELNKRRKIGNSYVIDSSQSKKKKLESQYSRGTYYGVSSSSIIYQLCKNLNKSNLNVLWANIVSITSHFINQKMGFNKYKEQVERLRVDVTSKNDLRRKEEIRNYSIQLKQELKFDLLEHWSLYDSMYHSRFVASRLGIWKHGDKKLKELLLTIGIPLSEYQEQFKYMNPR